MKEFLPYTSIWSRRTLWSSRPMTRPLHREPRPPDRCCKRRSCRTNFREIINAGDRERLWIIVGWLLLVEFSFIFVIRCYRVTVFFAFFLSTILTACLIFSHFCWSVLSFCHPVFVACYLTFVFACFCVFPYLSFSFCPSIRLSIYPSFLYRSFIKFSLTWSLMIRPDIQTRVHL